MTTFWFSTPISFLGSPRGGVCERKHDVYLAGRSREGKIMERRTSCKFDRQTDIFSWAQFLKLLARLGSCSYSVDGK